MATQSEGSRQGGVLQCRVDSCLSEPEVHILNALKAGDFHQFCELLGDAGAGEDGVDPNHAYKDEHCKSLLHIACELEFDKFVEILLNNGANAAVLNTHLKMAPIHVAARRGNDVILKHLLDSGADVKARDGHGWTALHIVAMEAGKQESEDGDENYYIKCLHLLLDHQKVSVDEEDFDGQTALYLAALNDSREAAKLLLKHGASRTRRIHRKPIQTIIDEKFPGLLQEIECNQQATSNNSQIQENIENILYRLLQKGDMTGFVAALKEIKKHQTLSTLKTLLNGVVPDGSCTFLQFACQHGHHAAVEELLKDGVDPNCTSNNEWKPVLLAAHHGHYKVLEKFKECQKFSCFSAVGKNTLETVLHEVLKRDDSNWISTDKEHEAQECLRVLLDDKCHELAARIDTILNVQDNEGNTPLHYATLLNTEDIVKVLLRRGANIGIKNKHGETPVSRILPHTMEEFFNDHCLKTKGAITHKDFSVTFNYSFLAPPLKVSEDGAESSSDAEDPGSALIKQGQTQAQTKDREEVHGDALPETESLWYMSQSKRHRYLLKHPVVTSFLWLKWQRIRRYFYLNLALYVIFVAFLTAYMLLMYGGFQQLTEKSGGNENNATAGVEEDPPEGTQYIWYFVVFLTVFLIIREMFQIAVSLRRYIFSCENLLELLLIVLTCIVLFDQNTSEESKRHLAALIVLLSWTELVLMIGRHPRLSTYVTMFTQVSCSFFQFLLWYSVLVVAFAISFYILFHRERNVDEDTPFKTQESTLLKTVVMLVGELDFAAIPFTRNFISSFIFVLFLFLIVLVLVNLLNGLAVSDIQAIRDEAELVSYASRVELISYTESMLLGDPFLFLSNWPPFRWLQQLPSCAFCRLLYQVPTVKKFLTSITGDAGFLLFYSYLPDKKKTFYPNNKSYKNKKQETVENLTLSPEVLSSVKSVVLKRVACLQEEDVVTVVKELEKRLITEFTETINKTVMKEITELKAKVASIEENMKATTTVSR